MMISVSKVLPSKFFSIPAYPDCIQTHWMNRDRFSFVFTIYLDTDPPLQTGLNLDFTALGCSRGGGGGRLRVKPLFVIGRGP